MQIACGLWQESSGEFSLRMQFRVGRHRLQVPGAVSPEARTPCLIQNAPATLYPKIPSSPRESKLSGNWPEAYPIGWRSWINPSTSSTRTKRPGQCSRAQPLPDLTPSAMRLLPSGLIPVEPVRRPKCSRLPRCNVSPVRQEVTARLVGCSKPFR